ncbi:hypothetical protein K1719_030541 [Acacia pycnantha]|nr:hypothetical protein K1719_030541 [Acacia pycnantha]
MPITLCKLEMVFPLACLTQWNICRSLGLRSKVGGPQQYRWMYPFESFYAHLSKRSKIQGRVVGKRSRSTLDGRDKRVAECYFSNSVRSANPSMSESEVDQFTNSEFQKWLRSYFVENPSDPNEVAWSLSYGAAISVTDARNI